MTLQRDTATLRPHEENVRIYGDDADAGLIESVRQKGVLNPILITTDGTIISGHRRWRAAQVADLGAVPVSVYGSTDPLDILEALVESNRQRAKTNEQIGREASVLLRIEQERARRRQAHGATAPGKTLVEPVPQATPGKSRDHVGAKLGVSGKTAERAAHVVAVIDRLEADGKQVAAAALRTTLNRNAKAAHQQARQIEPPIERPTATVAAPEPTYSVEQWGALDHASRAEALATAPRGQFNRQETDSIEWALWSWNPVTGCLHNCPYCYARDIAERFYPQKFTPTLHPSRLAIPQRMKVPAAAANNIGEKNVFTCSMADLFGRWVPSEWITAVIEQVRRAPEWNFLFLTKFPQRLAEFEFPDNAWVGTSVDCQARVAVAEAAFRKVRATVKWLSCEPLIEPLRFSSLDMFQWIVIGGASASTQTPEYRPPFEWTAELHLTALRHGLKVYHKTNLYDRTRQYPGEPERKTVTPEAMRYLPTKAA